MLSDLEGVFRALKSELRLRPIPDQKPERNAGHLFITLLAYPFVQIIWHRLHEYGLTERWAASAALLRRSSVPTAGRTLHVRKAIQPKSH